MPSNFMGDGFMERRERQPNLVVLVALVLTFFAIPHLIDDFLYGIPAEFGLSEPAAQVLSSIFAVVLVLSTVAAGKGLRMGYYACACLGITLALAGLLKHVPRMIDPGPYWGGLFSELLIVGLILSGLLLAIVAWRALRG
jgi:hypothetical protein